MSKYNQTLIAAAAGLVVPQRKLVRARTMDQMYGGMQTFDRATIDAAGAFLIGELERLDQEIHGPLAAFTWSRDINLREDVTLADDVSSFTRTEFAAPNGTAASAKSWIGRTTTAITGTGVDTQKIVTPLNLWGQELGWSVKELAASIQMGRPVDADKLRGLNFKFNMDVDAQVYVGDTGLGVTGLLNNPSVSVSNTQNGASGSPLWTSKTPDEILADVNAILNAAWAASAYTFVPTRLLVPPSSLSMLVSQKVSSAGNISVLNYLKDNSLSNTVNGTPLEVLPVKWLETAGVGGTRRMVAYRKEHDKVRFPMVPMQRTPLEMRGILQMVTYYAALGGVEVVYPETMAYRDGI